MLAARRAVAADIARLRKLADRLAVSEDAIAGRRADSRFQIEVAVCAQSSRLTRAEVNMQAELSAMVWLPRVGLDAAAEASRHHQLVDAIEAEDQTGARSLAEEHSTSIIRRLIPLRMELARL